MYKDKKYVTLKNKNVNEYTIYKHFHELNIVSFHLIWFLTFKSLQFLFCCDGVMSMLLLQSVHYGDFIGHIVEIFINKDPGWLWGDGHCCREIGAHLGLVFVFISVFGLIFFIVIPKWWHGKFFQAYFSKWCVDCTIFGMSSYLCWDILLWGPGWLSCLPHPWLFQAWIPNVIEWPQEVDLCSLFLVRKA